MASARSAQPAEPPEASEALLSAVQRQLARLRFDLHDGPQQDLHLLAQDLALFRDQLRPAIEHHPDAERLLGRLDDLEAELMALDAKLRRLITTIESPFLAPGGVRRALRELTDGFRARTGVRPHTRVHGDLENLSDSQQITVLSLVREALSNIRKHSDARKVEIEIVSDADGIRVAIADDGRGFDPQATLVRAANGGHLGLVGMRERVGMLGGSMRIDSRPGGPTRIEATLPRWPQPGEA